MKEKSLISMINQRIFKMIIVSVPTTMYNHTNVHQVDCNMYVLKVVKFLVKFVALYQQ